MKDSARSMVPKPNPGIDDSASAKCTGQFVNPIAFPPKVKRTGYLGVERPANRGKRYSDDFTGDKGSSK